MTKVSVIVPVYNVKTYLKKCVESLVNQSFDDYEIMLIDDGSSDGSEKICDYYAKKYKKVNVLHKENGGLSDARNYGVKHSRSDYIVFVDSDDYVDKDYVGYLKSLIDKYHAELAVTGFSYVECSRDKYTICSKKEYCVDSESAFQKMCYGREIPIMAWGKMIKRTQLLKHPFPYGVLNEDVGTTYKIILDSSKIAIGDKPTYHYVNRDTSILHTSNGKKFFYGVEAANNIIYEVRKRKLSKKSEIAAVGRLMIESTGLLHRTAYNLDIYNESAQLVRRLLKGSLHKIIFNRELSLSRRCQTLIFTINDNLYRKLYVLKRRK